MSNLATGARRRGAAVAAVALLVYLVTAGGSLGTKDAVATYEVTRAIVHQGSVALPEGHTHMATLRGRDGRYYSPFGIGQSLYNIPFYLAGLTVERMSGLGVGPPGTLTKAAVSVGSAFAAAGCVWIAYLFAWRLSGSPGAASWAAFSLAFASALWPYSKLGFNAALVSLCLTGGLYSVWLGTQVPGRKPLWWGGALLGAALLTRHEMVLACGAAIVWVAAVSSAAERRRRLLPVAAGPVGALVGWLTYNQVRFGHALYSGHTPALDVSGFAGLLVSPGGSLFVYSPIAVPGVIALGTLWSRDRRAAALLASVAVALFAFYGSLDDWLGTRSYGPRYLVPLLPILCIPLAPALGGPSAATWRRTTAAAVLAGVIVQFPGVLVDVGKVNVSLGRPGPVTAEERQHDWDTSALVLNTRAAVERLGPNVRWVLGVDRPPHASRRSTEDLSGHLAFSLDFWWLYLWYLGVIGRPAALGAPVLLLAAATGLALWSRRIDARV